MYDHDCDICDHHMWCDVIFIAKSQEINKKTKLQKKREIIKNGKQLSSLRRFLTFQVSKLGYKVSRMLLVDTSEAYYVVVQDL